MEGRLSDNESLKPNACDITWHGCDWENEKKIGRLQQTTGRIVLQTPDIGIES